MMTLSCRYIIDGGVVKKVLVVYFGFVIIADL